MSSGPSPVQSIMHSAFDADGESDLAHAVMTGERLQMPGTRFSHLSLLPHLTKSR
jgi:hypothetical protein